MCIGVCIALISKGLHYMYTAVLLIQTSHHTALCVHLSCMYSECSLFSFLSRIFVHTRVHVRTSLNWISKQLAHTDWLREHVHVCVYVCGFVIDHSSPSLFPMPLTNCSCVICCMGLEFSELCIPFPLNVLCVWHTVARLYTARTIVKSWSIGNDPLQVVHITSM